MIEGSWYRYDISRKSDHLIIGFGSARMFQDRDKNKGFEWDNTLKYKFQDYNFNVMFVGDINNSWWHTTYDGLDGYGPMTLLNYLNEKIEESGSTKTLFLGVSMGGYGAILFGCLTGATKVMAFSPQTFLSSHRRKKRLTRKFKPYDVDESLTDLKQVLEEHDLGETEYHIWFGKKNIHDKSAANRISHIKGVNLHPVNTKNHNPIEPVIRRGTLKKEIVKFLDM